MHDCHDKLFRFLFRQPPCAVALVRRALSPAITEHLDTASLVPTASSLIDRYLAEHRPDLVYQAPLAGESAYAIIEHQSTEDASMASRFADYMAALRLEHAARYTSTAGPVFLPILVYQGGGKRGPWRASRRLSECFSLPDETARAVRQLVEVEPAMLDLSTLTDADLRAADMGPVPTLGLWALARVRYSKDLPADFASVIDLAAAAYRSPEDRLSLQAILEYILMHALETHSDAFDRILHMSLPHEEHELSTPIIDSIVAQGRQEGLALGEARGRQEGLVLGQRTLVHKLLEQRFGALPPHVREHLERAGLDELEAMAMRVLSAATLDEILAPNRP